jgi:hypothetical protein
MNQLFSLDIDALFGSTSPTRVKVEGGEDANGKGKRRASEDDGNDSSSKRRATTGLNNKVISNETPIDDFKRIVSESSGNEFMEKAVSLRFRGSSRHGSSSSLTWGLLRIRWRI